MISFIIFDTVSEEERERGVSDLQLSHEEVHERISKRDHNVSMLLTGCLKIVAIRTVVMLELGAFRFASAIDEQRPMVTW